MYCIVEIFEDINVNLTVQSHGLYAGSLKHVITKKVVPLIVIPQNGVTVRLFEYIYSDFIQKIISGQISCSLHHKYK